MLKSDLVTLFRDADVIADELIDEIDVYAKSTDYRRATNIAVNLRLIKLNVPIVIRNKLITDGLDVEWYDMFKQHIIPVLTEVI